MVTGEDRRIVDGITDITVSWVNFKRIGDSEIGAITLSLLASKRVFDDNFFTGVQYLCDIKTTRTSRRQEWNKF